MCIRRKAGTGEIITGNGLGDTSVVVSLPLLPPDGQATITLQMTVATIPGALNVEQQSVTRFDDPKGGFLTSFSDDPDTSLIGDPTASGLYGIRDSNNLFLPIILRR